MTAPEFFPAFGWADRDGRSYVWPEDLNISRDEFWEFLIWVVAPTPQDRQALAAKMGAPYYGYSSKSDWLQMVTEWVLRRRIAPDVDWDAVGVSPVCPECGSDNPNERWADDCRQVFHPWIPSF